MNQKIIFLSILLFLSAENSFAQKGFSFGVSAVVSKNFMVVDRRHSSSTHLKTTTDFVEKIKLNFNYDLSKQYFLSFGVGIYRQSFSLRRDMPWTSERNWKHTENERILNLFDFPYPYCSLSFGFRKDIGRKTEFHFSTGVESHLLTTYFGPLEKNQIRGGLTYNIGDSTYYETNYNFREMKKRISLEISMESGISFITKNYSEFNIFLSYQKGLYKVMTGENLYFEKAPLSSGMDENYCLNHTPDETYNFFTRDSNLGIGISYLINWNELKKNKKLEKQYENLQSK